MDAKERLRAYLEQRRELGESELVLDSLPVDAVMRMLGDHSPAPVRPAAPPKGAAATKPAAPTPTPAPEAPHAPRPGSPANVARPSAAAPAARPVGSAPATVARPPAAVEAAQSLSAIADLVARCQACGLHAAAKNPVPGEGNITADFVCVGEGPGATEDEQGRPFVGAAGELLTKILEAIQLRREDVFICNVVKHRPPGNRTPAPDEIAACSPFLFRQLELLKPKVILALGTTAAHTLLSTKDALGKLRQQEHSWRGVPLVVTYHPAALLRNPNWKRPTWEDVQLARRLLDRALGTG